MTEQEYKDEIAASQIINRLNIKAFLLKIKEKALQWKKELEHGN